MQPRVENQPPATPSRAEELFEQHFELPPLPDVAARLLEIINSDEGNAARVTEVLVTDPSLVALILKMVNSAYFGLPHRINGVKHAVAYLGLAEIRRLVLAVSVMEVFRPEDAEPFRRFWHHSFYTALAAKFLAKRYFRSIDADALHTAALLHDIGKLVYLRFFPDDYQRLVEYSRVHGTLITEAESQLGLPSHQTLGAMLCDHWKLPALVKLACCHHEAQDLEALNESGEFRDEIQVLCLANLLSGLETESFSPDTKNTIRDQAMNSLGCDEQAFILLMGEIYDLRLEVDRFLQEL